MGLRWLTFLIVHAGIVTMPIDPGFSIPGIISFSAMKLGSPIKETVDI